MVTFLDSLEARWRDSNTLVCVGLDPLPDRFPKAILASPDPILSFNKAIIDATADLVCAYKPQIAHYAALGAEDSLVQTITYIHDQFPGVPVILDAKRGDVGSTATQYAREAFERYRADAVTVNPWLGFDAVKPFLQYTGKGIIVLCRTSNASAADIQDLVADGRPVYLHVAEQVVSRWNREGNCLLVVGATKPEPMAEIRRIAPDIPFLVPGIGAQGGDVGAVVRNGVRADGKGLVINSSRAILYADDASGFTETARQATLTLRDAINQERP
jgi:orotidine-5'-phosphate decarboxylase